MATDIQKEYWNAKLKFESDKITFDSTVDNDKFSPGTLEVMMDWERPIMEKMAELTVSEGDHVLECGFGMGILSDAIQARNPASHTICENHPDIIPKMREWASGKSNIILHEDRWLTLINGNTRYDSILMDTYADDDLHPRFREFANRKGVKTGCKITWWNFSGGDSDPYMKFYWDNVSFTDVAVDPPLNSYYNKDVYKVPLKILTPWTTGMGVVAGTKTDDERFHSGFYNYNDAIISKDLDSTKRILAVHNEDILTCADPSNPNLVPKASGRTVAMTGKGVYIINDGLIKVTGNHPMIIKRDGSWIEKPMNEVVVGDKLFKILPEGEEEILKIDFDSSDTKYCISRVLINGNYFVNHILMKGDENA